MSLSTRYELANGFTSTPPRLLGDLEEKHLPQTFSIATRVAHDGIRIVVTSVRVTLSNLKVQHLKDARSFSEGADWPYSHRGYIAIHVECTGPIAFH